MNYRPCKHDILIPAQCSDCNLAVNDPNFIAWREDLPIDIVPVIVDEEMLKKEELYAPPIKSLKSYMQRLECKYKGSKVSGTSCGRTLYICNFDNTYCNTTKQCSKSKRCCQQCPYFEQK